MAPTAKGASDPFGILLVAHGDLAKVLARVVEQILGSPLGVETVSVGWNDDVEASRRRVEDAVRRVNRGRGVLILTDMFGGTPTNLALPFLKERDVEIVTGVNLPMLVKVPSVRDAPGTLREAADKLRDVGQGAMQLATLYLEKPGGGSKPS